MPGWPFHFCSLRFALLFAAYRVWKTGVACRDAMVLWEGHKRCFKPTLMKFMLVWSASLGNNATEQCKKFDFQLLSSGYLLLKCESDGWTWWTWNQLAFDQSTHTHMHSHACLRPCLSLSFSPLVYSVACDHLDLTCIVAELVSLFCSLSLPLLLLSVINFQALQFAKKEREKSEWVVEG